MTYCETVTNKTNTITYLVSKRTKSFIKSSKILIGSQMFFILRNMGMFVSVRCKKYKVGETAEIALLNLFNCQA